MYYKRSKGSLLSGKSRDVAEWICWTHHSKGKTHCEECLILDGCWFEDGKTPRWPHHAACHCTLDPINYTVVLAKASTNSDYSKFVPYLFNTLGIHPHGKDKLFAEWGYSVDDARWLQAEMERQARENTFLVNMNLESSISMGSGSAF